LIVNRDGHGWKCFVEPELKEVCHCPELGPLDFWSLKER